MTEKRKFEAGVYGKRRPGVKPRPTPFHERSAGKSCRAPPAFSRLADEPLNIAHVQLLMNPLADAFGDVIPNDRAVQIVAAPIKRELAQADALHDPECLDVSDVVHHEAGDGESLQVAQPGVAGKVAEFTIFRGERQWNDAIEVCPVAPKRFALQLTQFYQMSNPLSGRLNVSVEAWWHSSECSAHGPCGALQTSDLLELSL